MDDLDDLLAGMDALDDFLAESFRLDLLDEIPGDLEINIRIKKGRADIAQRIGDVGLRDFPKAAEIAEGILQLLA